MGRSRRRLKKTVAKVKVGVIKRKKNLKTRLPVEVTENRTDVEARLNQSNQWEEESTLLENYAANKLLMDPNDGFGRNIKPLPLKSKEERLANEEETYSDDDELRSICDVERKSGKALPARLTPTQRQIIQRLLDRYGDNVEAMMRDRKLNPMQHSVGKLKMMIASFQFWTEEDGHDFRAPNKPPKRLL